MYNVSINECVNAGVVQQIYNRCCGCPFSMESMLQLDTRTKLVIEFI